MSSATGLVAAFAIVALAVNVLPTSDRTGPPGAGTGSTFSVAADGSGDYRTISEAVAAAAAGDTVMVRPGTYTEAILIDKDITLMGDGPREDIVIEAPVDGPTWATAAAGFIGVDDNDVPYGLALDSTAASIAGLSFSNGAAIVADGGTPTITDVAMTDETIYVTGGSRAVVSDGILTGPRASIHVTGGSAPAITGNSVTGGRIVVLDHGDGLAVRGNTIASTERSDQGYQQAIMLDSGAWATIEGNVITEPGTYGITVGSAGQPFRETRTVDIIGNTISGATQAGIHIDRPDVPVIVADNRLDGNRIGIIAADGTRLIADNRVRDAITGIVIGRGSPVVSSNDVADGGVGLTVASGASPLLSGNTLCGNVRNLVQGAGAQPAIDDTNEICEDEPSP